MARISMEQELRLIELETKNLEFSYWSQPKGEIRQHYIGVAHTEQRRILDEFYKKWGIKKL